MSTTSVTESSRHTDVDAIVIGGGFAGLHLLHKLVDAGLSTCLMEADADVGGVWRRNTYPGARTDIENWMFNDAFTGLSDRWDWSERFPTQPEVLAYLEYAVTTCGLRAHIRCDTRVNSAMYDGGTNAWRVSTSGGDALTCAYLVVAVGSSAPQVVPDVAGLRRFRGRVCVTSDWPAGGVDVAGKKVAVIGTNATGVQVIPVLARTAARLTVVQPTAHYVLPVRDSPARVGAREHAIGTTDAIPAHKAPDSDTAEFVRDRIRAIVKDPATATLLCPKPSLAGEERLLLGHFYYETFNRHNVALVGVDAGAVIEATTTGVRIGDREVEAEVLIVAAATEGPSVRASRMNIRGRNGEAMRDLGAGNPRTHLGTAVDEFPNLFIVSGPQIPFANAPVVVDRIAGWLGGVIQQARFPGDHVTGMSAERARPSRRRRSAAASQRRRSAHRKQGRPAHRNPDGRSARQPTISALTSAQGRDST